MAEHLTRIESIIMDDLLGSFTNIIINPDEFEMFKNMAIKDSENSGFTSDEQFKRMLENMYNNMDTENTLEEDEGVEE